MHTADGRAVDDGYFTIVLNTNPYTYLGNRPLDLSPAATLDDAARRDHVPHHDAWAPILARARSALRGGGVRSIEQLLEWRCRRAIIVEHDTPFPYQLDGDYLGDVERLEFDNVPNAVRLVFPASAA